MNGLILKWNPESRTGLVHACPEDQFFALLGRDNQAVADQLDQIFPSASTRTAAAPARQILYK